MNKTLHRFLCLALVLALGVSLAAPALAAGTDAAVKAVSLPSQDWQGAAAFPDWKNCVDDTLAMNSLYSFTGLAGQGRLYVTPPPGGARLPPVFHKAPGGTPPPGGGGPQGWGPGLSKKAGWTR